jgi:HlyD family secretion protein
MDRPLADSLRRRRRLQLAWRAGLVVACVVTAFVLLRLRIEPSVRRGHIRVARVERGPVEATLTATGTVVPLVEHVLTCPIDTRVLRVRRTPGARVAVGDTLIELDAGEARLAVGTLEDQIALKRNEQHRTRLELESTLADLRRRHQIKEVELRSLQYESSRNHTLFERGLFSGDAVRKADADVERAQIELQQLAETMDAAQHTYTARDEGLRLEMKILAKQHAEAAHVLHIATGVADRPGVLTWVLASEGASVRRGDPIARVADLSSFRVDATVSDVHAGRLAAGMPATVQVGEVHLRGVVSTVHPAVENGAVTFDVSLENASDEHLRPNLRVDVHAITASKEDVLRIARGTYGAPDGSTWAFVVRGDHAVRTRVHLGITGFESFEVLDGLREGDEVIVSDTSDFMHHQEVALR